MKLIKKNWKKIIIAFLFLTAVSTYFIGSYFVNYALVANSGGEKRPDKKNLTSEEVIKEKHKKFLDEKRDKWLKDVAKNTKYIEVKTNDGLKLYGHTYTQKKILTIGLFLCTVTNLAKKDHKCLLQIFMN